MFAFQQLLQNISPVSIQSLNNQAEIKNHIPLQPNNLENKVILPPEDKLYDLHPLPPVDRYDVLFVFIDIV